MSWEFSSAPILLFLVSQEVWVLEFSFFHALSELDCDFPAADGELSPLCVLMNQACCGIKPLLENICAKSYAKIAQINLMGFFSNLQISYSIYGTLKQSAFFSFQGKKT